MCSKNWHSSLTEFEVVVVVVMVGGWGRGRGDLTVGLPLCHFYKQDPWLPPETVIKQ